MTEPYLWMETAGERVHNFHRKRESKNYYSRYVDYTCGQKSTTLPTTKLYQACINTQKILKSLDVQTIELVEEVGRDGPSGSY